MNFNELEVEEMTQVIFPQAIWYRSRHESKTDRNGTARNTSKRNRKGAAGDLDSFQTVKDNAAQSRQSQRPRRRLSTWSGARSGFQDPEQFLGVQSFRIIEFLNFEFTNSERAA